MNLAIVLAWVPTARLKGSNGLTLITSPFADLGSNFVDAEPSTGAQGHVVVLILPLAGRGFNVAHAGARRLARLEHRSDTPSW